MKLFPNQIKALEEVFELVVQQHKVLDIELKNQVDKNKKWGSKDRKNFYQASYTIIRNYELLDFIGQQINKNIIDSYLEYQREGALDYERIKLEYPEIPFHTYNSIPKEVYDIFKRENAHADKNIIAMHSIGDIYLRLNTSLISLAEFEKKLKLNEIGYEIISSIQLGGNEIKLDCIRLKERTQNQKKFFEEHEKFFEIQDLGSQILTEFIDLEEANTIIESCAGNGGKTSHIIDKTRQSNPLIISFDKERKKLEHLQGRISKWNNHKVVTELAKEKEIKKYDSLADILYIDAPCTGSGTLKRQADLKYRISEKMLEEKTQLQREIVENFHETLKLGGVLVYSTCSLFQSENNAQIEFILSKGYELIASLNLEPMNYEGDGFFIAKFKKIRKE